MRTDRSVTPNWGIDLAPLFGAHGAAGHDAAFGAGAAVIAGYRHGRFRPAGWFWAQYRFPFEVDDVDVPTQAQTISLRLLGAFDLFRNNTAAMHLGAGGGVDIFHIRAHVLRNRGRHATRQTTRATPIIAVSLLTRLHVASNVQFFAAAGVDFDPLQPHLEIGDANDDSTRPWVVRPGLILGFSFTVAGTGPLAQDPEPARALD